MTPKIMLLIGNLVLLTLIIGYFTHSKKESDAITSSENISDYDGSKRQRCQNLEHSFEMLDQTFNRLQRRVYALEKKEAISCGCEDENDEGDNLKDDENIPENTDNDEVEAQEELARMDAAFNSEARNNERAEQMLYFIDEALSKYTSINTEIISSECKTNLCRIIVRHQDRQSKHAFSNICLEIPTHKCYLQESKNSEDENLNTIAYFQTE